ncbi:hypothetical protein DM860_013129 [Cuscuta australis]|uniref:Endonuclease/exonuclease/phosphatase domain-containing protein n=1 Tax=Cuscuta australis TaxID=267555 RepID=A0A328D798_9ASTE|nr:hypothetical protein DM860_013129 [Cuscuta australis]
MYKAHTFNHPWIVGGDFNTVLSFDEHKGNSNPDFNDMDDFRTCIDACGLHSPPFTGGIFTWTGVISKGKLWRRLDRVLINSNSNMLFSDISISHLSKTSSDHKPILLLCKEEGFQGPKPFRFLNVWATHHNFLTTVNDYWVNSPRTGGMAGLAMKLKGLKSTLSNWNKLHFGNIFQEKGSGQQINIHKSCFYTANKVNSTKIATMAESLSMDHGTLPFTYLGATMIKGKLKKHHCSKLLGHFDKYMNSWFSTTLNPMGTLVLIKHVLSSIPLHIIAVHCLPQSIIKSLHMKMANFVWGFKNVDGPTPRSNLNLNQHILEWNLSQRRNNLKGHLRDRSTADGEWSTAACPAEGRHFQPVNNGRPPVNRHGDLEIRRVEI